MCNDTLISYLCNNGAAKTLISEAAYLKIKSSRAIQLRPYRGNSLTSATGKIQILGKININEVKMSKSIKLRNVEALVAKDFLGYECFLGRDWQGKIPGLKNQLKQTRNLVKKMTSTLTAEQNSNQTEKKNNKIIK